jgi:hypothetical protein
VLETIGSYAFQETDSLTAIMVPSTVKLIDQYALSGCGSLVTVTFPSDSVLETIGSYAFQDTNSLTTIMVPSTVKLIDQYAFYECGSLRSVVILCGSSVTIAESAFTETLLASFGGLGLPVTATCDECGVPIYNIPCIDCRDVPKTGVLSVPNNVNSIGDYAFQGCSSLRTIDFSMADNLLNIGRNSFNSTNIKNIEIPESVISVGKNAFANCKHLTNIILKGKITAIEDGVFYKNVMLKTINIPSTVAKIDNNAFDGCLSLSSIAFSANSQLSSIGNNAFRNTKLRSFVVEPSVNYIGIGAFSETKSLEKVSFFCGCDVIIDTNAFLNSNINSISIPTGAVCQNCGANQVELPCVSCDNVNEKGVLSIPADVGNIASKNFQNCRELIKTVKFDPYSNMTSIGNNAFEETSIESIEIPETIKDIGQYVFHNCKYLRTVTLNEGLQSIGNYSFYSSGLVTVTIPASVGTIEYYAFSNCAFLTQVLFEKDSMLHGLMDYAFHNSSLVSITIPNSLSIISEHVFDGCFNLETLNFVTNSILIDIQDYAFYGTPLKEVILPSSLKSIGVSSFSYCNFLREISFGEKNMDTSQLVSIGERAFQGSGISEAITFPSSHLENIGAFAFSQCSSLGEIKFSSGGIDDSLSLGNYVFSGTNILELDIPNTVKMIGSSAFSSCTNLKDLTISCNNRVTIYESAFSNTKIAKESISLSVSLPISASCIDCGLEVNDIKVSCAPTQAPTSGGNTIVKTVNNSLINLSSIDPKLWMYLAVFAAIGIGAFGVFVVNLRKPEKSVVDIPLGKVGFMMALIGSDVITSLVLIIDMVNSKYKGWGIVVAMMRAIHFVVGIYILLSIYGPSFLHFVVGLRPMMANVHMGNNPKIYALASVFVLFHNGALMLLPWRNSEFSQRSFGLPTMDIFRTVQYTTIIAATFTIASQIPYLSGTTFEQNPAIVFFYINIVINGFKVGITVFSYCVHAAFLSESSTKFIDKDIINNETNVENKKNEKKNDPELGEEKEIELTDVGSSPLHKNVKDKEDKDNDSLVNNRINILEKKVSDILELMNKK